MLISYSDLKKKKTGISDISSKFSCKFSWPLRKLLYQTSSTITKMLSISINSMPFWTVFGLTEIKSYAPTGTVLWASVSIACVACSARAVLPSPASSQLPCPILCATSSLPHGEACSCVSTRAKQCQFRPRRPVLQKVVRCLRITI